jgi:hypothetical protein
LLPVPRGDADASTASETTPTTCAGEVSPVAGNPNPVALVSTVVPRKNAVHTLNCAPARSPPTTMSPAMMPNTLMTT